MITRRFLARMMAAFPGAILLDHPRQQAEARKKRRRKKRKRSERSCPPCQKRQRGRCRRKGRDGRPCGDCRECWGGQCIEMVEAIECRPPVPDPEPLDCYTTIPESYRGTDVASLIHIQNRDQAERKRQEIIDFLWKGKGLPDGDLLDVQENVASPVPEQDLTHLAGVDELAVTMDQLTSYAYHFRPVAPAGRLMLYHAGHSERLGDIGGSRTIRFFLERGYDVVGFFMPGFGPNTRLPEAPSRHDSFAPLETPDFTPLTYFLDPVAVVLNFLSSRQDFTRIGMIGISGGGWTTTLYAAIDPRIQFSFPVAGSLPLFLRVPPCVSPGTAGDWEQTGSQLYEFVDYTELYVLGAYGQGRRQMQILNQYDSCCFFGVFYQLYEDEVRQVVADLEAGAFEVALDSSTRGEHGITPWALDQIAALLD